MILVRKSEERGHFNHGWLDSYHSFSFGDYFDPKFMGFRSLRVINEDYIQSSEGFPTHGHKNMEIITYVLKGELEHKDSMGNGSLIRVGDVQRMSAGTGVKHSEYNHSQKDMLHLLQIWIIPGRDGNTPSYEQKYYSEEDKKNKLKLIASSDGRDSSVTVHQDISLYASILEEGQEFKVDLKSNRGTWIQVIRGAIEMNGIQLGPGDAAAVEEEKTLKFKSKKTSEFLFFDLK